MAAATGAAALAGLGGCNLPPDQDRAEETDQSASLPWYRRARRWGQTNITEIDPDRYDIAWWRRHWKRTGVQGVIINAGGILAYYPSKFPLHRRPEKLGDRDLFGELARAAREDGLAVLARIDSNRAGEDFYRAHPDWFTLDANGKPYRAGELYIACINGPYYEEYIPGILREIIKRARPDGFADNSWSGLGRGSICHCVNCEKRFRAAAGFPLPSTNNWDDAGFRRWIQWSYARRLEIWDLNNRITQEAGGPDCLWIGMNSGSMISQCQTFRDLKEICGRARFLLLDHQARNDAAGFQNNGETGKLVHGLLGWDPIVPESMAMYQAGRPAFRLASKPEPEARLWMLEGFAGGIQPWWHHVGAYHEDRRMYRTAEPLYRWHRENEDILFNRRPVATVGLVWSRENIDFHGRDQPEDLVELPMRGWTNALIRGRIPYLPVHADHIERQGQDLALLILPNLAALSDRQAAAIRRFVEKGGGLIATCHSSRYDEWGDPRPDFALADLLGAHLAAESSAGSEAGQRRWAFGSYHTYLRLSPELRAGVPGPKTGDEPEITGERHPILSGFGETDILPFGGMLEPLRVEEGAVVPMTFIPEFPIYPPETAWMRQPRTSIPGLILRALEKGGRVAFLPADLDRRFARDHLPDHGNLLANVARWASRDDIPLAVSGPGFIDCHLYCQGNRLILHLINLTGAGTWRAPVEELIPIGPFRVRARLPAVCEAGKVELRVSRNPVDSTFRDGWATFELPSIFDHEVAVIGK